MRLRSLVVGACIIAGTAGCSVILGTPDDGGLPDPSRPVRVRYVETLRNQESLVAQRYQQTDLRAPSATSLQRPVTVVADQFRVYVLDRSSQPRIFIFDRTTRTVSIITQPKSQLPTTPFVDPSSIGADPAGHLIIADPAQGRVFGMDRAGTLVFTIGKAGGLGFPVALVVDQQDRSIYLADKFSHKVQVFSQFGDWVRDIGDRVGPEGLRKPVAVCQDATGFLYVLDAETLRVHVFDRNGAALRQVALMTDVAHPLNGPAGLAVDSSGHLYVTDAVNNAVMIYDRNGTYLQRWGGTGSQVDGFWSPSGIFIDPRDAIYIADQMNGRVQVYQYEK